MQQQSRAAAGVDHRQPGDGRNYQHVPAAAVKTSRALSPPADNPIYESRRSDMQSGGMTGIRNDGVSSVILRSPVRGGLVMAAEVRCRRGEQAGLAGLCFQCGDYPGRFAGMMYGAHSADGIKRITPQFRLTSGDTGAPGILQPDWSICSPGYASGCARHLWSFFNSLFPLCPCLEWVGGR
jgi:hypothetical protein